MFEGIAKAGLKSFCPDILGSPESIYNQIHQHIALETFSVTVQLGGYNSMGLNPHLLSKPALLNEWYQSYLFKYQKDLAKRELKIPGSMKTRVVKKNIHSRGREVGSYYIASI